jgi:hypothetical protein
MEGARCDRARLSTVLPSRPGRCSVDGRRQGTRVIPAVLDASPRLKSPHAGSIALAKMSAEDP